MDTKNIIEIVEKGNRLDFKTSYTPIVCGNSGYYLKFEFDEKWQKCNRKTAILILENKKFAIDFEGVMVEVPPLPNSAWLYVALTSSYDDTVVMCTTTLKIRLEPSVVAEDITEFDPISAYFPKIIGTLNKFEQGDLVAGEANHSNTSTHATTASSAESAATALTANHAITADSATSAVSSNYATTAGSSATQVDLIADQTVSGIKNFVDGLMVNSKNVATNEQISSLNQTISLLNNKFELVNEFELLYDKNSSDVNINKGYTSGLLGGVDYSINLDKYKRVIITYTIYAGNNADNTGGYDNILILGLTQPSKFADYYQAGSTISYYTPSGWAEGFFKSWFRYNKTDKTLRCHFANGIESYDNLVDSAYVSKIEGVF